MNNGEAKISLFMFFSGVGVGGWGYLFSYIAPVQAIVF